MNEQHTTATDLWKHLFGDGHGLLQIWTVERVGDETPDDTIRFCNFNYPAAADTAAEWALEKAQEEGREVYFCTHLLTSAERTKENAAEVSALWADLDGAPIPNGSLTPTGIVQTSREKFHVYWRLADPIPPDTAEDLNRRLAREIAADSGWHLTKLMRLPGTTNNKYSGRPPVVLCGTTDEAYSSRELDELLPRLEEPGVAAEHEPGEDEEEPPVALGADALKVWRGERPKLKESGELDRSASLVNIGRVLYDAGANRRVVIDGMRERDEALGWCKYAGRPDAEKRYAEIFDKELKKNGRTGGRVTVIPGGRGSADEVPDVSDVSDVFSPTFKVPPFPVDALPEACSDYVREAAAALNCAPELVGLPVLGTLSGTIGHSRALQIKPGWEVSANLYAVVIDFPGSKKTPAQQLALKPVEKLQRQLRKAYLAEKQDYEEKLRLHAVAKKNATKANEPEPEPPARPKMVRALVDDTTVEALAVRLEENPRGLLSAHDELTGFIRGLDQYKSGGKGNARQAYMKIWANAPIIVDRKGSDEPVIVPHPFVTLQGAIQPGVLSELPGGRNDGFLDRFVFAYPEPRPGGYSEETVSPDVDAAYKAVVNRLWAMKPGEDEDGDPIPRYVSMSPRAKFLFVDAANALAREAHAAGFPAVLRGPWAKLDTQLAKLALIIYTARDEADENYLTADDMRCALRLLDYFKACARKVYGQLHEANSDDVLAEDLRLFLSEHGHEYRGTVSDLLQRLDSHALPDNAKSLGRALVRINKASPDVSLDRRPMGDRRLIVLTLAKTSETSETSGEEDELVL